MRGSIVLVAHALISGRARAEGPSKAGDLKRTADTLVAAEEYESAVRLYDQSYALSSDPAILYNRGRALAKLGRYPEAFDSFDSFARLAPANLKARVPNLAKTIEEVSAKIAMVVVHCNIAGATIRVRGTPIGTTPLDGFRTSAGNALVEVIKDGYTPYQTESDLSGGETTNIDVVLFETHAKYIAPPLPEPEPTIEPIRVTRRRSGWVVGSIAIGVAGLGSIGAGSMLFAMAANDKRIVDAHCPMKACDARGTSALSEARTLVDVSTVLAIAGAVGVATGVALFVFAPKSTVTIGFSGVGGVF